MLKLGVFQKEVEEEVKEAKENVKELSGITKALKELNIPQLLKNFGIFVVKQLTIGAIFYGVTVALKKLTAGGGSDSAANKQKLAKTKALSTMIKDLSTSSKTLLDWLKEKQNVVIDVGDGITVPLPDIFTKFTGPIKTVSILNDTIH